MQEKKEKKEKKNTVLAELKSKEVWLIHENKRPISVLTLKPTGASPDHAKEWTTYEKAEAFLDSCNSENNSNSSDSNKSSGGNGGNGKGDSESTQKLEQSAGQSAEQKGETPLKARGLGFVVPEGYFFVDVDHAEPTSDIVKELKQLFPTYAEISLSGNGIHFYGRCDVSMIPQEEKDGKKILSERYFIKNTAKGLEVYIGGLTNRFSTFTGMCISDVSDAVDCSKELLIFLETRMRRNPPQPLEDDEINDLDRKIKENADNYEDLIATDDDEKYVRLNESDINNIVDDLRKFQNGQKFIDLYDKGLVEARKSPSEADASLCALIAFRVGPDEELIDQIFRKSALYRDKWDRDDYAKRTIKAGIEACKGNFYHGVRKRPPFVTANDKGKESLDTTRFEKYIRDNLNLIIVRDEEQTSSRIHVYRRGVYKFLSDDTFEGVIRKYVDNYNDHLIKSGSLQEVSRLIKKTEFIFANDDLNSNENYINLENGLLNINTLELRPHTHKLLSTIQLPVEWGPLQQAGIEEPTPIFDAYMNDLTEGNEDIYRFLLQFMGACYSNIPGFLFKKSLFLLGPGNSGKSQLKTLVESMLGYGNYASIDLATIEARFGTSYLYGKRLAGSSDMKFMKIPELNTFKSITAGDSIFAERKGQDGFFFKYKGLLWFCMNELPKFGGDSGKWVYDRIIIIPCNNVIPPEKRNSHLYKQMFAERNGIFYKAIMAFHKIYIRGVKDGVRMFDEPACAYEMRKFYNIENSPTIKFFVTCMEERQGGIGSRDVSRIKTIYAVYKAWYTKEGYNINYLKSVNDFTKEIAAYVGIPYEDMTHRTHFGTSLKAYVLTQEAIKEFGAHIPDNARGAFED